MAKKVSKYEVVKELPDNAMTVKQYADNWNNGNGCNTSYIYELISKGKNVGLFKIVEFKGINFIIP